MEFSHAGFCRKRQVIVFFHFLQKSVVSSTNVAYSLIRQEAVFVRMHG